MKLSDTVETLPRIGKRYSAKLSKLGLFKIDDLLRYSPFRFLDFTKTKKIRDLKPDEIVSVEGEIVSLKNIFSKRGVAMQVGSIKDETGQITVVWFNQTFLTRAFYPGKRAGFAGRVSFFSNKLALVSPEYEMVQENGVQTHTKGLVPIYHETAGISSKVIRSMAKNAISETTVKEYLPKEIIKKHNFFGIEKTFLENHFPKNLNSHEKAIKRLAFEEMLFINLKGLKKKKDWEKKVSSHKFSVSKKELENFIKDLPFKLTNSQITSIEQIGIDMTKDKPMNRLLQGDVGSGKTIVAAASAFICFLNGAQSVFMAPTQILAEQHANSLEKIFEKYKIRVSLITSTSKSESLGRSDVFVGTHALIHRKIKFDKVGLVVIDEQQRFGVEQRELLIKKSKIRKKVPHFLTTTATPIPRTIAESLYADLSVSVLSELPSHRQKITTWIVPPEKRGGAYKWMEDEILKNKSQIFIVCPLIEESEKESMKTVKSAKSEFEKLSKIFIGHKIGLLHGKLKATEKADVLKEFNDGRIDILVATPVVEVGIDIPNATIIAIETPERFGLSQLHQLRGRVGRGYKKSYCLLFTEGEEEEATERLKALTKTTSGFELSELDFKLRGPGDLFGVAQSGFNELKIASWQDELLLKETKKLAETILDEENKYEELLNIAVEL